MRAVSGYIEPACSPFPYFGFCTSVFSTCSPTISSSGTCEKRIQESYVVKCELTIDNSEAVQQCLAIKPVVVLCVSNFKHPRTIAEQPARQPGRNTAWTGERSCYLSHSHKMMFVFVTFHSSFHWSRLLFYGLA